MKPSRLRPHSVVRWLAVLPVLYSALVLAQPSHAPVRENGREVLDGASEEAALTVNEPMYFVTGSGSNSDTTARFQVSFMYRPFATDGPVVGVAPWLEWFYLGYTQTTLWNLSVESNPFEGTTYRPSLFWQFESSTDVPLPDFLRFGYEHESNGQGSELSRSMDTLFLFPAWRTALLDRELLIGAKLYGYLTKSDDNEDIDEYRGYADMVLRYGNEDNWLASLSWRRGSANRHSVQLDLSYPIRKRIQRRTGGYLYLQLFQGYGEELLTYDKQRDIQVRIGFGIVR